MITPPGPHTRDDAWPRHSLVRLTVSARERVLLTPSPDRDSNVVLRDWASNGWPLVVRRPLEAEPRRPGVVPIALALPPALGKRRLPFTVDAHDIDHMRPPLSLGEAVDRMPLAWRRPLAELNREAQANGVLLRVYGSVAWQALTRLAYLHDASDVDLLIRPRHHGDVATAIALLERWEQRSGRRADGEILFAGNAAVSWREWRAAQQRGAHVLVKTSTAAYLAPCAALVPSDDLVEHCA